MQGSTLVYLCGLHYFHHFLTFVIVMDFKQFANNGED